MHPAKIKKRNGAIMPFDASKIHVAVAKSLASAGKHDMSIPKSVADEVESLITEETPTVEHIQDTVEKVLIRRGHADTAKAYILYRDERNKIRDKKLEVLGMDSLDDVSHRLPLNSIRVLASRYLVRDMNGKIIENPSGMFKRVAATVTLSEILYDELIFDVSGGQPVHELEDVDFSVAAVGIKVGDYAINQWHVKSLFFQYARLNARKQMKVPFPHFCEMLRYGKFENYSDIFDRYYTLMSRGTFLPNSPTLMNAGGRLGQLSACFVLDMDDSLDSIMDATKDAATIFQSGGGVGINYSNLRPDGSIVASTSGVASGPVSFMNIINSVTEVVKQGGKRRGANMGILDSSHPDIEKFIQAKNTPGVLENFNVSVGTYEEFWDDVRNGKKHTLRYSDGEPKGEVDANQLLDSIAVSAWNSAEPGLLFFDHANAHNVMQEVRGGPLRATNPCVTGDTFVYTSDGLQRIESLWERQDLAKVELDSRMSGPKESRISRVMASGEKQVFKLKTKEGYEVKLTADHKVMTQRGWVESCKLVKGDKIRLLDHAGGFGTNGSHELGSSLGWLVGDGTLKKERAVLSFFGEKRELAPKFAAMVQVIVPPPIGLRKHYTIGACDVAGRDETRVSSTRFGQIAVQCGLEHGNKHVVPDIVFQGTKSMQKGFLQALFTADGSVGRGRGVHGTTVRLTSIAYDMLVDVQRLLLNFGIASRIYANRRKASMRMLPNGKGGTSEYNCKAYHDLVISKANVSVFAAEVGFILKRKQESLSEDMSSYKRTMMDEDFIVRFKELVPCGVEQVYDLTEPATHSFIANGLTISNCGEQSLYPNESCNLGSINIGKFVDEVGNFDWDGYIEAIRDCSQFLDGVVDANVYPTVETQKASLETRRTGLGLMGVADCLAKMGIRYDSKEGYTMMAKLCEFLTFHSMVHSVTLAQSRGAFELCDKTDYIEGKLPISGPYERQTLCDWDGLVEKIKEYGIRNVLTTTIAPTGTIAMIAGCSNGIEPFYSLVYTKEVSVGKFQYINDMLSKKLEAAGLDSKKIMEDIEDNGGSLDGASGVPHQIKDSFRTAMDIHWADHVVAQAMCQDWIGNAISKTINMPSSARIQDVKAAYVLAHGMGLNGITVYRDGSRATQVLSGGNGSVTTPTMDCLTLAKERLQHGDMPYVSHLFGHDKTCECGGTMQCIGGCHTCQICGLSLCSSA